MFSLRLAKDIMGHYRNKRETVKTFLEKVAACRKIEEAIRIGMRYAQVELRIDDLRYNVEKLLCSPWYRLSIFGSTVSGFGSGGCLYHLTTEHYLVLRTNKFNRE